MPKKILLVDDDELVRLLVRTTIESADYALIEAEDGQQALDIVSQEKPHLVLLDLNMPGVNGLQVCRTIKSSPELSSTIVVMLTAVPGDAARAEALQAGADMYFSKPFSPLDLLRKLRELLGG